MRDNRLDVIRGLAILLITINHTYPGRDFAIERGHYQVNIGLSFNGADVFVAFSGLVCGIVYRKTISEQGLATGIRRSISRAMQIFMFNAIAFICVAGVVLLFGRVSAVAPVHGFEDFLQAAKGTIFLYDPIPYFNILNLYIALLLVLPVFVFLQNATIAPIVISASLYVIYGTAAFLGFSFQGDSPFFVSPLAWQFMFFGGVTIGMNYQRIRSLLPPLRSSIGFIMLYLLVTHFMRENGWIVHRLSGKFELGILRLVDLILVCYVIDRLVAPNVEITAPVLRRISSIGSNSLFCFSTTLVVCYTGSSLLSALNGGRVAYLAVLLAEIFLMIALGHALQSNSRFRRITQAKWLGLPHKSNVEKA